MDKVTSTAAAIGHLTNTSGVDSTKMLNNDKHQNEKNGNSPNTTTTNILPVADKTTSKPPEPRVNIFNCKDDLKEGTTSSMLVNYEFSTPWCSKIEDYQLGITIGKGAYAEVKESVHKKTGEKVAIKQYDRYKLLDLQRKKQAIREIKILSGLEHPNIVKLHESIDTHKYVYLVMEFIKGESLHAHLKAAPLRQFSEEKALKIIK